VYIYTRGINHRQFLAPLCAIPQIGRYLTVCYEIT